MFYFILKKESEPQKHYLIKSSEGASPYVKTNEIKAIQNLRSVSLYVAQGSVIERLRARAQAGSR